MNSERAEVRAAHGERVEPWNDWNDLLPAYCGLGIELIGPCDLAVLLIRRR